MNLVVEERSCKGNKRAKSSIAVSTTEVMGGGGSISWYSLSESLA